VHACTVMRRGLERKPGDAPMSSKSRGRMAASVGIKHGCRRDTMGQAATVSSKLSETAGSLSSGSTAIQELLRDYRQQRDAVTQLVAELRSAVEAARREASLTSDVLARIEGSATRLGTAQKLADEYLDGVSKVLGEAHNSFASEVKRTLDKANVEFHTKLAQAVGMLHAAVGELEVTLASMGNLTPVRR
jgi:hypothetical protein